MKCLDRMIEKAQKAIDETNPKNGCKHWQDEFGDRFSCSTAKDEKEAEKLIGNLMAELRSYLGDADFLKNFETEF